MAAGSSPAAALADVESAALAQWRAAGGHALPSADGPLAHASREAFVLLQSSAAVDVACGRARAALRTLNAAEDATPALTAPQVTPFKKAGPEDDDHSDGSELQGRLVAQNVRPSKPELPLTPGEHRAPDGTLRLLQPELVSPAECDHLIAGGLVAMAGAFTRCGQTTLGLSPAIAHRTV
eukprot:6922144-Prymnesium_polylepis.1